MLLVFWDFSYLITLEVEGWGGGQASPNIQCEITRYLDRPTAHNELTCGNWNKAVLLSLFCINIYNHKYLYLLSTIITMINKTCKFARGKNSREVLEYKVITWLNHKVLPNNHPCRDLDINGAFPPLQKRWWKYQIASDRDTLKDSWCSCTKRNTNWSRCNPQSRRIAGLLTKAVCYCRTIDSNLLKFKVYHRQHAGILNWFYW